MPINIPVKPIAELFKANHIYKPNAEKIKAVELQILDILTNQYPDANRIIIETINESKLLYSVNMPSGEHKCFLSFSAVFEELAKLPIDRFSLQGLDAKSSNLFVSRLIETMAGDTATFNLFELPLTQHEAFVFMRHLKDNEGWAGAPFFAVDDVNDDTVTVVDQFTLCEIPLVQIATVLNQELEAYHVPQSL